MVTSGPGATNIVTALTDANMDSITIVCISGQVPTHLIGTDAFQECDTTGITRPCTKHNWLVKDVNKLSSIMHKAFEVATTGRPGPVLIDIPKDIQFQKGKYTKPKELENNKFKMENHFRDGNYAAASKIQYDTIPDLENNIKTLTQTLEESRFVKLDVRTNDIAEVVSKWTGIPVQKMLEGEKKKLLNLESVFRNRVVGQEEALKKSHDQTYSSNH